MPTKMKEGIRAQIWNKKSWFVKMLHISCWVLLSVSFLYGQKRTVPSFIIAYVTPLRVIFFVSHLCVRSRILSFILFATYSMITLNAFCFELLELNECKTMNFVWKLNRSNSSNMSHRKSFRNLIYVSDIMFDAMNLVNKLSQSQTNIWTIPWNWFHMAWEMFFFIIFLNK